MKFYLRVFVLSLVVFTLLFGSGLYAYLNYLQRQVDLVEVGTNTDLTAGQGKDTALEVREIKDLETLEELVEVSKRVNVVVIGIDGGRADTIMFASYDPDYKLVDIVTIPRDTYNEVPGYDGLGQKKINSVYGYGDENGGSNGVRVQVSQLLGVPIHHYVRVNYNGVKDIVDTIGGVEVNVHKDLKYDDPFSDPPLHIDIKQGRRTLNGQKSVEYLRWRKNNGEEGSDLDRTERQVAFVKSAIVKTITNFKLVTVIETAFNYIYTDMPLQDMTYYASTIGGFDPGTGIDAHRLPGETMYNGLSYYVHNPQETESLMIDIYKRGALNEE